MVHQGKPFDRLSKGSWGLVFPTGSWSSSHPPVSERPLPLGHNSAGRAELRGGTNPCSSGHSHLRVESNETGSQRVFHCVVDRQENGARRGQDTCPVRVSPRGFTTPAVGAAPTSLGCTCLPPGENSGPRTARAPLATVPASPWLSCLTNAARLASGSAALPGSSCAAPQWLLEEPKDFGRLGVRGVAQDVHQCCVQGTLSPAF